MDARGVCVDARYIVVLVYVGAFYLFALGVYYIYGNGEEECVNLLLVDAW